MTERIHDPRTPVDKNDSTQSQNPQPELGHSGTLGYERPPIDPTTGKPVYGTRGIQEEHLGDPAGLAKLEDADRKEVEAIAGIVYGPEAVGTDTTVNPGKIDSDIEQEGNKKADKSRKIGGKTIALVTAGLVGVTSAVVGAIAYFSPKEVSANPGATPSASAPVTPGPSPSSVESSAAASPSPTEASSTPSASAGETKSTNNEKLAAQLEKQESMTPEAFFKLPKADQMLFLGAVLKKSENFQDGYYDTNLPIDREDSQLYNFNPLLNTKSPEKMTDQDILNQYRYNLQAAYHGTDLDAKGEYYKSFDLDTAKKTSMLVSYYPSGSDFKNLLANIEAYGSGSGSIGGTINANSEMSENIHGNTDHEGNRHLSRRVAYTMEYHKDPNDPDSELIKVKETMNFFWQEGELPDGTKFGTWINYNV